MKKLFSLIIITAFISSCGMGLQVRGSATGSGSGTSTGSGSSTDGGNPNGGGNGSNGSFTVGGTATGIPHGQGVNVTVTGHNYPINQNGSFTFPLQFTSGETYSVAIANAPTGAYTCALQNDSGTVANANVTNVLLTCTCGAGSLGTGTGTQSNPILVYTSQQLNTFALTATSSTLSKNYKQICDLDYTGVSPSPIGSVSNAFTGTYDGNGFFVLNYTSDSSSASKDGQKGLFGWTDGANLKNVNFSNVNLSPDAGMGNSENPASMGALAGTANNSAIENIYAENVTASDNGQVFHGLAGLIGNLTISNSCTTSYLQNVHVENINLNGGSSQEVAGVVGSTEVGANVIEANNVNVNSCTSQCGGVVGGLFNEVSFKDIDAQNSTIEGNQNTGGIAGENVGSLERTAFVGTVNGLTSAGGFGGLVGYSTSNQLIKNSYTVSDVLSVSGTNKAGNVFGYQALISNVAYDSANTCENCSVNSGTTAQPNSTTFKAGSDASMAAWNFTSVWCTNESGFPRLVSVPFSLCE